MFYKESRTKLSGIVRSTKSAPLFSEKTAIKFADFGTFLSSSRFPEGFFKNLIARKRIFTFALDKERVFTVSAQDGFHHVFY